MFLLGAFFVNVFLLARKGIFFGASDLETVRFPIKRYAIITLCIATAVMLACSTIRFVIYFADGGYFSTPNHPLNFYAMARHALFIFSITFAFFLLIFYIAFKIAKRNLEKYSITSENMDTTEEKEFLL